MLRPQILQGLGSSIIHSYLVVESSFSFPSGHVTASVAAYGFLAVLPWRNRRYGWVITCGALVLLVALSRICLGVHYPSDMLDHSPLLRCG